MAQINSYRDLEVWQRGIAITKEVYLLTRQLPNDEIFGLTSQMRRAAVSIPSNIAEGHAKTTAHFKNHLTITLGSIAELETQLSLAMEIYPKTSDSSEKTLNDLDILGKMLRTLMQKLPK